MSTFIDYQDSGVFVLTPEPTGAGGKKLNDNFRRLVDLGLAGVVWDQPKDITTQSAGDKYAAIRACIRRHAVNPATIYSPSSTWWTLLAVSANPAWIDYCVVSPGATAINAACHFANALDGIDYPFMIQYSTDNGATFTTFASDSGHDTDLSGTLPLSQTTLRTPLIIRFRVEAATFRSDLVGLSNISISTEGSPLILQAPAPAAALVDVDTSATSGTTPGELVWDSVAGHFMGWTGSAWVQLD
jgi:hypothetical protein